MWKWIKKLFRPWKINDNERQTITPDYDKIDKR
jgi:hypothetical protein